MVTKMVNSNHIFYIIAQQFRYMCLLIREAQSQFFLTLHRENRVYIFYALPRYSCDNTVVFAQVEKGDTHSDGGRSSSRGRYLSGTMWKEAASVSGCNEGE